MRFRTSPRRAGLCLGALLSAAAPCFARAESPQTTHPYTVDDYLKLEDTGKAMVDPTGRWLVYERMPPYDQLPDYSVGRIGTWSEEGGHLMVVDLSEPAPRARPLFEPDPKKTYWVDGFSPDGSRFAFYAAERSHITVGVCDMATRKVTGFDAAPRVDWLSGHKSVWLSPSTFVFGAMAPGDQPSALSFRGHTGELSAEAWRRSWEGKQPSVGVVESHADGGGHDLLSGRLVKADAASGRMEVLATGQFEDLEVSADGRYLAALQQADMAQPDPKRVSADWISARSQLVLFDLGRGGPLRVIAADLDIFPGTIAWAPDSDRLVFFGWKVGEGVQSGLFQALDAATGARTPYPHTGLDLASMRERGWAQRPERVVWIGDRLAVFARAAATADAAPHFTYRDITTRGASAPPKADWFLLGPGGQKENLTPGLREISGVPVSATSRQLFVLADGAVWRLESGKPAVNLTPNAGANLRHPGPPWGSPDAPPFRSFATFESERAGKSVFTMVDLTTGKSSQVEAPSAGATLLVSSARSGAVLFRENSNAGATLLLSRSGGAPPVSLERLNTHLAAVSPMRWVPLRYPAAGGREIESCVLLPPGYEAGKRYPAIVEVYPGYVPRCTDPTRRESYQLGNRPGSYTLDLLAAQGYVVMQTSAPSGLIQSPDGPVAKLPEVTLLAVDALVAQGYAEPNRIGLLGLSQGGFSSLWVATQTDRFKATVSLNGWSDLFSHYFQGPSEAYARFYANEFRFGSEAARYEATAGTDFPIGRTPWEDPMAYIRNSAVFQAPKVTTPIMMIHSDLDAFGLTQYDEMFAALYRLRKEAKYVRYWGEGHSPSSPANLRDMWGKIFAWYAQYLGK